MGKVACLGMRWEAGGWTFQHLPGQRGQHMKTPNVMQHMAGPVPPRLGLLCRPSIWAGRLRTGPYLKGLIRERPPSAFKLPGQGWATLSDLSLSAQVSGMAQAICLRLCSVRIPQAKEKTLHAITLLARSHTRELVTTFLDISIPLDRCLPLFPHCPPPVLSPGGGGDLCPPVCHHHGPQGSL